MYYYRNNFDLIDLREDMEAPQNERAVQDGCVAFNSMTGGFYVLSCHGVDGLEAALVWSFEPDEDYTISILWPEADEQSDFPNMVDICPESNIECFDLLVDRETKQPVMLADYVSLLIKEQKEDILGD